MLARNAERAGRLSRQDASDRMSRSAERALLPTSRGKDDERPLAPTALIRVSERSEASRPTFFRSAARGPHVPARLTPEPAKHEARKRRASERPRVGCCEEFGGPFL